MKTIHYYRVSTQRQGDSGLGLKAQQTAVEQFCRNHDATMLAEYREVESGKNNDRPQLKAAMDHAALTGATLVVAKLDRLSRNAAFLAQIMDSDVSIRFADMPFADRFTIGIMAQVAQWETEQISRRTKEALAATKARGKKLGGDRGNLSHVSDQGRARSLEVRKANSTKRKEQLAPFIAAARAAGADSLAAIARYLNDLSIKTPRGGQWYAASVARLLA